MASETEDGIVYPSSNDEYALISDLGAMAASIQEALETRANTRIGTQSERVFYTSEMPEGTLWWDTTGSGGLYVRRGTGWTLIFPEPENRRVLAGSLVREIGQPFLVLGQVLQGITYASTLIQTIYEDKPNFQMRHIVNNDMVARWVFNHDGLLTYSDLDADAPLRIHPFAVRTGRLLVDGYTADEKFQREVVFPDGYFTEAPVVTCTPQTGSPENTYVSIGNPITADKVIFEMYREGISNAPFYIHWTATQWYR